MTWHSLPSFKSVLIDTWWNVNIDSGYRGEIHAIVLIDTWWNVNSSFLTPFPSDLFVLIDTWWNVNDTEEIIIKRVSSFNRYMVECEF